MSKYMVKKRWELQKLFIMIQVILFPIIGIYLVYRRDWHTLQPSRICSVSIDILGMVILILLFFTCVKDREDLTFRTGCFTYLVSLNSWGFLCDLICWIVDEDPKHVVLNTIVNEAFYITGVMMLMIFWYYLVEISESENPKLMKLTRFLNIAGAVSLVAIIVNYWGHYYFRVGADGVYVREKYYMCSHLFLALMIICLMNLITRMEITKGKKAALMSFVTCPIISMTIQIEFYGISVSQVGILCALILIYGNVFAEQNRELALEKVKNMEKEREIFLAKREKQRLQTELSLASEIQTHIIPRVFPPFPEYKEFQLYASMTTAKEVGGDFYDFFQVDADHIALVIADVSGKGIPAALYMMVAKTMIKNACKQFGSPKDVLTLVNQQLCEGVDGVAMFVTVWLGILEVKTGKVVASNGGHEYPAICRRDGEFELLKDRHGLVLGGMEGIRYKEYEFQLNPGDTLFVYTDGVTEANNLQEELYGTGRMLQALNQDPHATPEVLLSNMLTSIQEFTGEEPQFDDITMLALRMLDPEEENGGVGV